MGRGDLDPNFGGLDPGGGMIMGPGHPAFGARGGGGGGVGGFPGALLRLASPVFVQMAS